MRPDAMRRPLPERLGRRTYTPSFVSETACMQRFALVLLCVLGFNSAATAQFTQPPGNRGSGLAEVTTAAITGQPFGVFSTQLALPPGLDADDIRIIVNERDDRVMFPTTRIIKRQIREAVAPRGGGLGRPGGLIDRIRTAVRPEESVRDVPVAIQISGLFSGNEALSITLSGALEQQINIVPTAPRASAYRQMLNAWWNMYVEGARQQVAGGDFPKLVHRYLLSMLATRLGLPPVDLDPPPEKEEEPETITIKTLALLAAVDAKREQVLEDLLSSPAEQVQDYLPLPAEPIWQEPVVPAAAAGIGIEPMAQRVPPECFYLRFGSFSNYVWFQELAQRFGGDLAQAVMMRGFSYDATARIEQMLATKLTAVAKMFGDQLVSDMAVIGSDLYMNEGASLGVILYSTNVGLLKTAVDGDRRTVANNDKQATLQTVVLAGKDVSLLSTPDNRIRSFCVVDGPCVFVTTSQKLAERFIEVGQGGPSLADTNEFLWARQWMPDANDYSVFAYFSPDFFHRLVSPQYQVELHRRLEAIAHLEVAEVASQAAAAEHLTTHSIASLKQNGFLPAWFDSRADRSQTIYAGDRWIDAQRGARGSFLPIADTTITEVTAAEAAAYAETATFFQKEWQSMDPMLFGLRRFKNETDDSEIVTFEGYIAPFDADKYGWIAKQLGAPTQVEIQLPQSDAANVQVHMRGTASSLGLTPEDYYLFAGIKDTTPPSKEETAGLLKTLQALKSLPAYLGAWPKPGLVENLPLGIGLNLARPDYLGFSRMIGGLWRWQNDSFSLLSFDRSILEDATGQLAPVTATDDAQVRVDVKNLQGSELADWIDGIWYARGWTASQGNALLMDTIHQQLHVPTEDCLEVAQRLLDVRLQCPLGGEYEVSKLRSGELGWWQSTAWQAAGRDANGGPTPPPEYAAPWIEWFRGGRVHITQQPDSLAVVGQMTLDMPPLPADLTPAVPTALPSLNFDLFGLPQKLFGGGKDDKPKAAPRRSF